MDCAVEAARVAAAGGTVAQEKTLIGPYGFMALCLDTRVIPSASIQWCDICDLEKNGLDSLGIQPVRFARSEGRSTQ